MKQPLVICLSLVVTAGGCGFTKSKNEAEAIAERYFEAAEQGDNEAVLRTKSSSGGSSNVKGDRQPTRTRTSCFP